MSVQDDTTIPPLKRCSKCGIEKPATAEFFYKQKECLYGVRPECKVCNSACGKGRYDPQKAHAQYKRYYETHSDEVKQRSNRYYHSNTERCNARARAYYNANREAIAKQAREYRKSHAEDELRRRREWAERNPDRRRAIANKYARSNRDKQAAWRHSHTENTRHYAYKWRTANPHKALAIVQRRRARKRNLPDTFTDADWRRALDYFDHRCAVCGRPRGLWHTLAMDHWIPLSSPECLGTIPENMVPLCQGQQGCNNSKNHHNPVQWLTQKFGKRKANAILERIEAYFEWVRKQR